MSNQFALCGDCTIRLVDQNGRSFWYVEKYCKKCFKELKKKSWQNKNSHAIIST